MNLTTQPAPCLPGCHMQPGDTDAADLTARGQVIQVPAPIHEQGCPNYGSAVLISPRAQPPRIGATLSSLSPMLRHHLNPGIITDQ